MTESNIYGPNRLNKNATLEDVISELIAEGSRIEKAFDDAGSWAGENPELCPEMPQERMAEAETRTANWSYRYALGVKELSTPFEVLRFLAWKCPEMGYKKAKALAEQAAKFSDGEWEALCSSTVNTPQE